MKRLLLCAVVVVALKGCIPAAMHADDKTQSQTQTAKQDQSAQSSSSSSGGVGTQNVMENFPHQAPAVFVPPADSTNSCRNAISLGGSFLTGGAGAGFSRSDSECEKRAAAEAFSKIGKDHEAFLLLCQLKVARELQSCEPQKKPKHRRFYWR